MGLPKNGGSDGMFVVDRPSRLERVIDDIMAFSTGGAGGGITMTQSKSIWQNETEVLELERLAGLVHTRDYMEHLKSTSETSGSVDRPIRLFPTYARTLVDSSSYMAALSAISDWVASVDAA